MRQTELSALTGIRFYAALFVYLSHLPDVIPGMGDVGGQCLIFNVGVVSVSFFFVLSGFILTYNYARVFGDGISGRNYKRFVWHRLTKIYPVHVLTMLLVFPIAALSPQHPLKWIAVPFHLALLQCWLPLPTQNLQDYLNVPAWSISCEFFFYTIAPLAIFAIAGRVRRWALVLLVLLGYAAWLGNTWRGASAHDQLFMVSWFAPSRVPEFLMGVLLARYFLLRGTRMGGLVAAVAQGAGMLLIVAGAMYRAHAPWPFWGGLLYVPGSALLILGLACGDGALVAHLSGQWMNRLGIASFSFYLIHAPVLRIAKNICHIAKWRVLTWPSYWLTAIGLFVMIQAVAFLICYRFELPVQRRLRRWPLSSGATRACAPAESRWAPVEGKIL